jgi:hypothetical protein
MSGLERMDLKLIQQYTGLYGPFVSGDYAIGDRIAVPGTSGEVIWCYHSCDGRGLVYVVDDNSGFPVEVKASEAKA